MSNRSQSSGHESGDDFYSVLGIEPGADAKAIRAAYRRRARQAHPDQGGSAEEFHQVQAAWEVLGSEESRAVYDRQRQQSSNGTSADGDSAAFRYGPGTWTAPSSRSGQRGAEHQQSASPQSQQPPVYRPDLSTPEPLSLTLTSQRIHGEFPSGRSLFGSGKAQRRHVRTANLLERHVLSELPAARLFNDVHLQPPETDRKGRRRHPKNSDRAEHVVVCGSSVVLVSSLEVPAAAASWDGRVLRAGGRAVTLPNLSAAARVLRQTLTHQLEAVHGHTAELRLAHQVILHSPDGGLLSPVVETTGPSSGTAPQAAGRAVRNIFGQLASSDQANVVDRYLLASLRDQLHTPDQG